MYWIVLVFLSALVGSLSKILQKILLKDKNSDPFAFSFILSMVVAFFFITYTLFTDTLSFPNLSPLIINFIIMAIFISLSNLFAFKAYKITPVSEVSIIFASSSIWSVITALIVLGEELTINKIIGVILVILGIIVINYSKTKWQINKGHVLALFGALFAGVSFINDVFILKHFKSISSYMIIAFTFPAILTFFYRPNLINKISFILNKKNLLNLLVCGFLYSLGTFAIFEAYNQGGEASLISPISQTSIIFTVIFGYFFLKEKDKLPNKILGTLFAFIGVLFLI